jgi:hypothetical protein
VDLTIITSAASEGMSSMGTIYRSCVVCGASLVVAAGMVGAVEPSQLVCRPPVLCALLPISQGDEPVRDGPSGPRPQRPTAGFTVTGPTGPSGPVDLAVSSGPTRPTGPTYR